ncbi:MAG: tetratricopeptide repeat protein [Promethearchaeota archaeon]
MPSHDPAQSPRDATTLNESEFDIPQLKRVKYLIHRGKLDGALKELIELERMNKFKGTDKIKIQIHKSLIFTQMGDAQGGLRLADQVVEESQQIGVMSILFDAINARASALFELGEFNKCLDVIKSSEKILETCKAAGLPGYEIRESKLKFLKGKIYRKKGELGTALNYLQESFSFVNKYGNQYEKADLLNAIGIVYASRSENDSALEYLVKSLTLFNELENKSQVTKLTNNIGMLYWLKGELDQALEYFQQSLVLSEESGNKRYIASLLLNIGLIYRHKGELNSALSNFKKGLEIYRELKSKSELTTFYNNIGLILMMRGELEEASEYFQKGFEISKELEDKQELATCLNNIGNIHQVKGDMKKAILRYKESLSLYEEIGSNINTCRMLYLLILSLVIEGSMKEADLYLKKLQKINEKEDNKIISQAYRLGKAILLRASDRIITRAEAQNLFFEITQEEIVNFEFSFYSVISLCDLLLLELRITGNEEVLQEIKTILTQFLEIAEKQHTYYWLIQIYWIQSKLALLELDIERSQRLLIQAKTLSEEKGLQMLTTQISSEYEALITQIGKWEEIFDKEPSMNEIIELTQLEDLLERMIHSRIYRREAEVMAYAEKAKVLIQKWEG